MTHCRPALLPALFLALLSAAPAWAEEAAEASKPMEPKPMEEEFCIGAAGFVEWFDTFAGLKPSRLDTVGAEMVMRFDFDPDEAPPERVELREGNTVRVLPFEEDGVRILLTEIVPGLPEAAQICVVDPDRAGRMHATRGYRFGFGSGVRYRSRSGTHDLAELEDGLKDGRAHYRKMAGAMGFMVPKFDHVAVAGNDPDAPPLLFATRGGQDLGALEGELLSGGRIVPMEALEALGADGVRVEDRPYRLSPSPSPKMVRRFMGE
ncbi:MAG: hypothetical protein WBA35_07165 [Litorimonas sp.]